MKFVIIIIVISTTPQAEEKSEYTKYMKKYFVYIMTNNSGTLYIGMTNNLRRRIAEHREMRIEGFTKRYKINKLIYFEEFDDVRYAIERETRLKTWSRQKKLDLIRTMNAEWKELDFN